MNNRKGPRQVISIYLCMNMMKLLVSNDFTDVVFIQVLSYVMHSVWATALEQQDYHDTFFH